MGKTSSWRKALAVFLGTATLLTGIRCPVVSVGAAAADSVNEHEMEVYVDQAVSGDSVNIGKSEETEPEDGMDIIVPEANILQDPEDGSSEENTYPDILESSVEENPKKDEFSPNEELVESGGDTSREEGADADAQAGAGTYNTVFEELPVYEDGVFYSPTNTYKHPSEPVQQGVLRLEDGKLRYYAGEVFQADFSGCLGLEREIGTAVAEFGGFYVKNGEVDTHYNGIVDGCYVVNGIVGSEPLNSLSMEHAYHNKMAEGVSITEVRSGISIKYKRFPEGQSGEFCVFRFCHETSEFLEYAHLDSNGTGFVDKNVTRGYTYTYYIWTCMKVSGINMVAVRSYVDATIAFGGDTPGKVSSYKSFKVPDNSSGDTFQWDLSDDGVLTISGTGPMPEYENEESPWGSQKDTIQTIVIEEGITTVSRGIFMGMSNLREVKLPSTAGYIEKGAFCDCAALERIDLGGVCVIDDYAFQGTKSLTSIQLPASFVKLRSLAFWEAGLQCFEIGENRHFTVRDGVLFDRDGSTLIAYPPGRPSEDYRIPSGVTVIGGDAFQNAPIQTVMIPDSVKYLMREAFYKSDLRSVSVPDSVVYIGDYAFSECRKLKSFSTGNGVTELEYCCMINCTSLEELILGRGIVKMDMMVFANCTALKEVRLNEVLKEIGEGAFGNTALTSVDVPVSVKYIGSAAFPKDCKLNFAKDSRLTEIGGVYCEVDIADIDVEYYYDYAFEVVKEVNKERVAEGLLPLKMDPELLQCAMVRAEETCIYFNHTRPCGEEWYSINKKASAENIAAGQGSASSAVKLWMGSSGHRGNILNKENIGIGVGCVRAGGILYWVQLFSQEEVPAEADAGNYKNHGGTARVAFLNDGPVGESLRPSIEKKTANVLDVGDSIDMDLCFDNTFRLVQERQSSIGFSSTDSSVCTVSQTGKVKAVAKGSVSIKAYLKNNPQVFRTVDIIVGVRAKDLELNYTEKWVRKGGTFKLKATVLPSNATDRSVTWESNDKDIAVIDENGCVTAKKPGKAYITAETNGGNVQTACRITVPYSITYQLEKGSNAKSNPSVYYNQEINLKAPSRKGYAFSGWYTDRQYKKKINKISKSSRKDMTLYAKWTKIRVKQAAVRNIKSTAGGKAKVTVGKVAGADGYRILYSTDKRMKKGTKTTFVSRSASKTITGLKRGKTYYAKVCAYKLDSAGSKVYGAYSRRKAVKIKKHTPR